MEIAYETVSVWILFALWVCPWFEGKGAYVVPQEPNSYARAHIFYYPWFENRQSFLTGLEIGDTLETWQDSVLYSQNVGGFCCGLTAMESSRRSETAHLGGSALMYSGNDQSGSVSYSYNRVFDVNIPVSADTQLAYWIYPQYQNATYVAIDMVFTDGSNLRDSGAVDQFGVRVHPGFQGNGGQLTIGAWTQIRSNIGQWLSGKTIDRILVAYDQYPNTGVFRGFVDDIIITEGSIP